MIAKYQPIISANQHICQVLTEKTIIGPFKKNLHDDSFDRKNLNNVYLMTKWVKAGIRTGKTVWWVQKIYFNPEEDNSYAM